MRQSTTLLLFLILLLTNKIDAQVTTANPAVISKPILKIPTNFSAKAKLVDSLKNVNFSAAQILTAFLPKYESPEFQDKLVENLLLMYKASFTSRELADAVRIQYPRMPIGMCAKAFYAAYNQMPGKDRLWANDLMGPIRFSYNEHVVNSNDGIIFLKQGNDSCFKVFNYFKFEITSIGLTEPMKIHSTGAYFRRFISAGYSVSEIYDQILEWNGYHTDSKWRDAFCSGLKYARVSATVIAQKLKAEGFSNPDIIKNLEFAGYTAADILAALQAN